MKRVRYWLLTGLAALLCAALLVGCGHEEQKESVTIETIEEQPEEQLEEPGYETWLQRYTVRASSVTLSDQREAVLFQQECEGGFLAYINRRTAVEIPEGYEDETEFFNDGRYDVYGSDLFIITESGRRNMIRRYRPLPAPESAEELEKYFSEMRPRAFRMRDDGKIVVLESSYESWLTREGTQTRDRYYVRLLNENGTAVSSSEIEIQPGAGLNCAEAVLLGDKLVAVPQGMEILFFGLDGKKQFSVTAPFPIREICGTRDGRLAVILKNDENLWLSVIHPGERTASMPQQLPKDVHGFCAGETADRLLCMQNSDILCYSLQNGTSEKLVSLLTVEAVPSTVSAFFAGKDGSLHFLLRGEKETGAADNLYLIASPCEIPTERRLLRVGFEEISDQLMREIVSFNRETSDVFLEAVDYRNLETEMTGDGLPALLVMNEQSYERLETEERLADLSLFLKEDGSGAREKLFPSVRSAFSDRSGEVRRIAASFRIRTMACDENTVGGKSRLSLGDLRDILAGMPAGSLLYEPYYTAGRLMEDLRKVNRNELDLGDGFDAELHAELQNFANLQPAGYSYDRYAADSASMESRIYSGKLLMLQAYLETLDDLKWYDAFFHSGACFAGWPTREGSRSRLVFEECIGISSDCPEELRLAAWRFVRRLLAEAYQENSPGFPAYRSLLERQMEADAAAVVYRVDEKGKFETDKNGRKIEVARDSWYSPEWRRHFVYALTERQKEKLLTLIENSV